MGGKILMKGNEATVYGALLAGCDCFFGYPITPASEIAHTAAALFPKLGRPFLQAESEIAAINMVFGAAAAGRRAMTASSGLGISLKQECVSYIATCELPAVIVDITRGGPGLGNIAPEQSDYNQVVKGGGHGSYKCVVLAPNSVQEMCDFTVLAFNLADKYLTPVYVMADGVVGQMLESITLPEANERRPVPPWAIAATPDTRRNIISSIYLDPNHLEEVNLRLQAKYAEIQAAEQRVETYETEDAELILTGFGCISRVIRTAVERLRTQGVKVGLIRPKTLFPFPIDEFKRLAAGQALGILCVEMNNGQMIDDVKLAIECSKPVSLFNRMGGNVPRLDEVIDAALRTIAALKGGVQS